MSTKYIASNWRLPNKAGVDSYLNDNYGLTFSGTSEYINCGNISSLQNTNILSISMWFNLNTLTTQRMLGHYTINNGLTIESDSNVIYFVIANGSLTFATLPISGNITTNTWFNIVMVYDGSQSSNETRLKAYLNNEEKTLSYVGNIPSSLAVNNSAVLGLGSTTPPTNVDMDGKISEVAIFDYALSSTQINSLYGSSSLGAGNPMVLNPVAFYPLGDNSSGNPLTQPNEAVEDASVFDFVSADGDRILCSPTPTPGTGPLNSINNAISISLWIKTTQSSVNQYPMLRSYLGGTNRDWEIRQRSDTNLFHIYFFNTSGTQLDIGLTGSTDPQGDAYIVTNDGNWHNVLVVYDGTDTAKIYVDGILQGSNTSASFGTLRTNARTTIGGYNNSGNAFAGAGSWNGQISNAVVWNSDQSSEKDNIYNSGVPATSYTNTPTAWYKLDQSANWDVSGSGYWDVPDASGNGNDGISSGMTSANLVLTDLTRNLPYDSYSFNFDAASSDYIEIADNSAFQITDNLTVSAWVYPVNKSATNTVVDKFFDGSDRAWIVRVQNSRFRIGISNTSGSASVTYETNTALTNNAWHHLLFTFNSTTNEVNQYINGVLDSASPHTKNDLIAVNTQPIRIGGGYNLSNFFDGKISNVSIFNQALTSTEVMKLYSNGMPQDLTSFTPAPVAWWTLGSNSFFNGTNFICKDLSGSNDGTSVNAGVDALKGNTPRSEANGTGTNQSIPENLVGTTKYSSNNSWSINMSESARVADTP